MTLAELEYIKKLIEDAVYKVVERQSINDQIAFGQVYKRIKDLEEKLGQ